jgi:hypothetical protein
MMSRPLTQLLACLCWLVSTAAPAQTSLPIVEDVDVAALREQCQQLLKVLEAVGAPFPAETDKELRALLRERPTAQTGERLQQLLDARCLVGVQINPESRVKAVRGPVAADLRRDRAGHVLVKVHNEAGVTAPLAVTGPQLRAAGNDGWLEAGVVTEAPLAKKLSGGKVDYVLLRLTARETGKREARLQFDVGQGTQDLGFRAEVPVLFTVRE